MGIGYRSRLVTGLLAIVAGILFQYGVLAIVDRQYSTFPAIPDILMDRLPRVTFGWYGELFFFLILGTFVYWYIFRQRRDLPSVLLSVGLFYLIRGLFLLLTPIGSPAGALPVADRLNIWGYASHAYFPGGHFGLMLLLSWQLNNKTLRRVIIAAAFIFGIGTILAKTHYTGDLLGGALLAYGVFAWMKSRSESTIS